MSSPLNIDFSDAEDFIGRQAASIGFADVEAFQTRNPQERAQAVFQELGVGVSPQFGATAPERVLADIAKGAVTSIPGAIALRATGQGETLEELERIPTAQPIPFFPDFDTIARLGGDVAAFSLLTPALGVTAGTGARVLGKGATRFVNRFPGVINRLKVPSSALSNLADKSARAVTFPTTFGAGFGGAEALAGRPREEVLLVGALGAAVTAFRPTFQALRAAAELRKVRAPNMLAAERHVAESFDIALKDAWVALRTGKTDPFEFVETLAESMAPGMGTQIRDAAMRLGQGAKLLDNIPELRKLGSTWELAVKNNVPNLLESLAAREGSMTTFWQNARGFMTGIEETLKRLGPMGRTLALKTRRGLENSERMQVGFNRRLAGFFKLSDDQASQVFDDLESLAGLSREAAEARIATFNPAVRPLVDILYKEIPPLLRPFGIDFRDLAFGYMPHLHDIARYKSWIRVPANQEKLARILGWPEGRITEQTLRMLDHVDDDVSTALRRQVFGADHARPLKTSLDFSRKFKINYKQARELGLPILDPKTTIRRYIEQVSDRVAVANEYGASLQGLRQPMIAIGRQFGPTVQKAVYQSVLRSIGVVEALGPLNRGLSGFMSAVVIPNKMGLAMISNAGQSINTVAQTSGRDVTRGLRMLIKEARRAKGKGIEPSDFFQEVKLAIQGITGQVEDLLVTGETAGGTGVSRTVGRNIGRWFLNHTGFNLVERFNRMLAAYSGKSFIERNLELARNGLLKGKKLTSMQREFRQLGLDLDGMITRGGVSHDELFRGALRVAELTQFRVRPFDLPLFWSSPNAAVFRMLKTFAFNQTRFVKNRILGSAARFAESGNVADLRPLAYFMSLYPGMGFAIGSIRDLIKQKPPFENLGPIEAIATAYGWVGGIGLLSDSIRSAEGGFKGIAELGAGPALSDLGHTYAAVYAAMFKDDPEALARVMFRRFVPGTSQNILGARTEVEEFFGLRKRKR